MLGCMDQEFAFALPVGNFRSLLKYLNTTTTERDRYWHLHVSEAGPKHFELIVPRRDNWSLDHFKVELKYEQDEGG